KLAGIRQTHERLYYCHVYPPNLMHRLPAKRKRSTPTRSNDERNGLSVPQVIQEPTTGVRHPSAVQASAMFKQGRGALRPQAGWLAPHGAVGPLPPTRALAGASA